MTVQVPQPQRLARWSMERTLRDTPAHSGLGSALCLEPPPLQLSHGSLSICVVAPNKAEGQRALLTPPQRSLGRGRTFVLERSLLWKHRPCRMLLVPSVAPHPGTHLCTQARLPQEAWLHREVPWARKCLQPTASTSASGGAAGLSPCLLRIV